MELKTAKAPAEQVVKDIRRATRKLHSSEEKIRIVLSGLRGKDSMAELCRKEGIAQSLCYSWSKEFPDAGKKRLAGDTTRQANTGEIKDLRAEALALKELVADLSLENRRLKKNKRGAGGEGEGDTPLPTSSKSSDWWSSRICRCAGRWRRWVVAFWS